MGVRVVVAVVVVKGIEPVGLRTSDRALEGANESPWDVANQFFWDLLAVFFMDSLWDAVFEATGTVVAQKGLFPIKEVSSGV